MIQQVHPEFQLNGLYYKNGELIDHATELRKSSDEYNRNLGDFLSLWLDNNKYIEVKTSGSTGTPKMIRLEKAKIQASAKATLNFFNLSPGNTSINCLPIEYIAGRMMVVRAMTGGLHMDSVAPTSKPLYNNNKFYDFCAMVPIQVQNSMDQLGQINTLIIGGAPCPEGFKKQLLTYKTKIYETYGMTETISHIAVRLLSNPGQDYFECLPGVNIKVDSRSCLVIDAPHLVPHEITTNDVVELKSDSAFRWLGRYDNVINVGGTKVFPEEVEKKLSIHIKERFFVFPEPDERMGEKVVLLIEGERRDLDLNIIKELARFETPQKIYFIPEFVETETSKIKRRESFELRTTPYQNFI